MQYLAIEPNLELKTWPKQLLGYLPLDIALPAPGLTLKTLNSMVKLAKTNTPNYYAAASETKN